MRHPAAVDVAGAVLVAVALAALALGAIAAVGRWPTEVTVAALSVATLSAAGALGLRIARAGHVVEVPVGPPTGEVPEWPPPNSIPSASRRNVLVGVGVVGVAGAAGGVLLARAERPPSGTAWRAGAHVVTTAGRRLHVEDVPKARA